MQSLKVQSLSLFNNLKVRRDTEGTAKADYYSFAKGWSAFHGTALFKRLSWFGIMNMPLTVRVFSNTLILLNLKVLWGYFRKGLSPTDYSSGSCYAL